MGEILPDGTIQGWFAKCVYCGATIETNMQGQGKCKVCGRRTYETKEERTERIHREAIEACRDFGENK